MGEIHDKLKQILADICEVDPTSIEDRGLLLGYGLDSVRAVDFIIALEETYALEIPDRDVENVRTVDDVASYIEKRLAG